jgi:D-sedoheptulose 7-phosphate isomerase
MANAPVRLPGPTAILAKEFLSLVAAALGEIDADVLEAVVNRLLVAHVAGKSAYVLGNGGSAATASHLACDLHAAVRGRAGLRVASLCDNVPLLTALANDHGYENVFTEQLHGLLDAGDVVIALSASGNSENVLRALRFAREHGATTVALLGFGGGAAATLAEHAAVMSSTDFGIVESVHATLVHLISASFKQRVAV